MTASVVYFIRQGTTGPIKIGTTSDIGARLRSLQQGNPVRLRVVALYPGGAAVEADFHRRFLTAHMGGEWFRPALDLLEAIRAGACKPVPAARSGRLRRSLVEEREPSGRASRKGLEAHASRAQRRDLAEGGQTPAARAVETLRRKRRNG